MKCLSLHLHCCQFYWHLLYGLTQKYKHNPARILESVPIFVIFVGLYYYTVIMEYTQCHRASITGVSYLNRYLHRCQILCPVLGLNTIYIPIYTYIQMCISLVGALRKLLSILVFMLLPAYTSRYSIWPINTLRCPFVS